MEDLETLLKSLLNGEHTSLNLAYNQQKLGYQTLTEEIETRALPGIAELDWVSEEEKQRALATDSFWELTWYPNTPVGHCSIAASSIEAIITWLKSQNNV